MQGKNPAKNEKSKGQTREFKFIDRPGSTFPAEQG
jgi:hypothetical protein